MTVTAALLLIAVGAILRFAIATVSAHGVDIHMIGDILMAVGAIGLVLWAAVWAPWARGGRRGYRPSPGEEEALAARRHENRYERDPYARDAYEPDPYDRDAYPREPRGGDPRRP